MNYSLYLAKRLSLAESGRKSSPAVKVAVAAVALSVAVMLAAVAIVMGFKREIESKVIGFNSHISLYAVPAQPGDDNLVTLTPSLSHLLEEQPYIRSFSLEATIPAILKTSDNFKGVYLKSLNGEAIRGFIGSNLEEGRIPEYKEGKESMDIVISRIQANQLGLKVGDRIDTYFISQDVKVRRLNVAGIFNSHFDNYDGIYVYGDLKLIQKLGGIKSDQGTALTIHTDDFNRVVDNSMLLHNTLLEALANGTVYRYYNVDNAYNQGAGYFHWLTLLDTNVVVILTLMTFVAIVTLISGMLIIIIDKKRFIGLIRSMGASVRGTRRVFLYLAMKIGVYGLLIGNVVALAILYAQDKWHFLPLDPDAYYIDFVPVELNWLSILTLNLGVVLMIWLALILPSRFVAKIPPAETMRTEE